MPSDQLHEAQGGPQVTVRIRLLPGGIAPKYTTDGSAGLDCYALEGGTLLGTCSELVADLDAGGAPTGRYHYETVIDRRKAPLGFAIELPPGYCAVIHPRSGLGSNLGVVAGIGANLVDEDYRGPVSALLFNLSSATFTWKSGERVAQMVVQRYERVEMQAVDSLDVTQRNESGFGSTGI